MVTNRLIPRLIFLTSALALLIPTIWIERDILIQTHGTIAYPLDDAFINLTLAKNFAFDHVWGLTKFSFSSVSTSLLYPFVLAVAFLVTGASLAVPLIINVISALWFLRALQHWLIRKNIPPLHQLLILLAVIFLTPLPPLVASGMEYPLELLFTFLFIASFAATATVRPLKKKTIVYGVLMVTSSYLTLPILLIACIFLTTRRQWWDAAKLLFFAILPLYLFGLLSITHHNYFVPNPILLTWGFPSLSANPYYPAFLIACTIAFTGAWLAKTARRRQTSTKDHAPATRLNWLTLFIAIPAALASATTFRHTPKNCIDVYTEQYQTAKFVYDYYYRDPIASNDLGAISFCADDARIVDLAGLANLEVLNRKRINNWTPASADSLSERMNANVAILHHSWSDAEVEPYWYRIATWQLPHDSVSFYSIDKRFIEKLQTNMHAFEPKLPPGVTVHYFPPID